jgi:hypothetical protein
MMGAVHLLPEATFSDVKQKGCYPSEASGMGERLKFSAAAAEFRVHPSAQATL